MNLHTCTFIDITWPNRQGPMKLIFQGSGFLRWEHFMKKDSTYMRKMYDYTDIYTLRLNCFMLKQYTTLGFAYCKRWCWLSLALLFASSSECANIQLKPCQVHQYITTCEPFSIHFCQRIDACINGRMDFLGSSLLSSMRKSFFIDTVTLPVVVNTAFEARETSKAAWSTLVQGREATPRWRHRHMPGGGREVWGIACMAYSLHGL